MTKYNLILKEKRKSLKLTQKEMAAKIGISRSYYGDIETGRTIPSGKVFLKINEITSIFLLNDDVGKKTYEMEESDNVPVTSR